jgi:Spy/CpxP family protein refolding chaperone
MNAISLLPRVSLLACTLGAACTFAVPAHGQVVVQRGEGQGGAWQGYVNPQGSSLQWLWGEQMEKELQIVPDQKEALTKLRNDTYAKMRTLYDMNIADPQERMKKYTEASKALGEETEKKVQAILLPHQLRRIKQIALQMQLQAVGYGGGGLGSGQLADDLKITDEQKAKLQERQKEVQKEMQEKTQAFYKQLQEESREKLFSVLTPEQRKQLDELIGEKFQWQPANPAPIPPGGAGGAQKNP